jgi:hypothetical protein
MLEVREGVQCTPCRLIERGNFEPLSPKKDFEFEFDLDFDIKVNCRRVNSGYLCFAGYWGNRGYV